MRKNNDYESIPVELEIENGAMDVNSYTQQQHRTDRAVVGLNERQAHVPRRGLDN